jgi:hypothetical protein
MDNVADKFRKCNKKICKTAKVFLSRPDIVCSSKDAENKQSRRVLTIKDISWVSELTQILRQ